DVAHAVAVVREDRPGDQRLVAYVVAAPGAVPDPAGLRAYAARALPEPMIPSVVVPLDALPLTPSGKLARRDLPAPSAAESGRAPRTAAEETLAGLFAEVLDVSDVGVDDGFFTLGGHSLQGIRLLSRIRSELGAELSVRDLFEAPTVAGLAARIDVGGEERPALRAAAHRPDVLPLSFAQRRLWFLHKLEGPSPTYNMPFALRLRGVVDHAALLAALADVVTRHEVLRTVYPEVDGTPRQLILAAEQAAPGLPVREVDEAGLADALTAAAGHRFDLTSGTPFHAELLALGADEHVLVLVLHHIAGDGWSNGPLARDLSEAYAARCSGQAPAWAPLPVQYADYTLWHHDLLGREDDPESLISRQTAYWADALADLPEELALPADRPRPAVAGHQGGRVPFALGATAHARLRELARDCDASLFMVLQAALAALLSRLGAGTDIPLGTPIAGRTDEALDEAVGCFVNTLVLRTSTSGNPAFTDLVARARQTSLSAYAHQDVPFEHLVEVLEPARSLARHPLFQVMLVLDDNTEPRLDLPGLQANPLPVGTAAAKFDLSFTVAEQDGKDGEAVGISGALDYASDLFDHGTAQDLAGRFVRLLDAVAADPGRRVGELEILDGAERERVLVGWNDTARVVASATLPE
ncbi:condensation domain-containing protein, partial [Streptomyces djakartensis]|uniref:condensation domain-containing protein n=1 Tax=Streptomyces djakartensis TaxID=68193 RepID=UPI001E381950